MIKYILNICCFLLFVKIAGAQDTSRLGKAIEILSDAAEVFKQQNLVMDVRYTYADEKTPDRITDSVSGHMLISGDNYKGELGNTLTVKNSRYSVIVFRDEKVLYVVRSNALTVDSVNLTPFQLISTALRSSAVVNCTIKEKGNSVILGFDFAEHMPNRRMQVELDKKGQKIMSVSYLIKKSLLPEEIDATTDLYALVRASFSYQEAHHVSESDFDEKQFFTMKANSLVPAGAYQDYEVFFGSPSN